MKTIRQTAEEYRQAAIENRRTGCFEHAKNYLRAYKWCVAIHFGEQPV